MVVFTNNHFTSIFTFMFGAAIFSLTKPRLHFNFEKLISPYFTTPNSGEAKQRWGKFLFGYILPLLLAAD
jgi:hypothetical protein